MAVDVSYIVPVYNALPELQRTVESLVGQDFDPQAYEVVFVDDGSTDGSGSFLDDVATQHANVRVEHIAASGGPSTPRNVGLSLAAGEYVFFCDADDWMEKSATKRMMRHAREWRPDVMLVKPKGEQGRRIAAGAFDRTLPNADAYTSDIGQALGPCKLFRRAFLREHDLAFTFDLPVWEDQPFVLKAYLLADRVSVAADGVYCHWLGNVDGSSSSARDRVSFQDACRYLQTMFDLVKEFGDVEKAKRLIIPRVLREGLFYAGKALQREAVQSGQAGAEPQSSQLSQEGKADCQAQFDKLAGIVAPYLTDEFFRICNVQRSLMYEAFRAGDAATWVEICMQPTDSDLFAQDVFTYDDGAMAISAEYRGSNGAAYAIDGRGRLPLGFGLDYLAWQDGSLVVSGSAAKRALYGFDRVALRLVRRDKGSWEDVVCDVSEDGQAMRVTAEVSPAVLACGDRATYWDVSLVATFSNGREKKQRIAVDDQDFGKTLSTLVTCAVASASTIVVLPYRTANGKLSVMDCLRTAKVSASKKLLGSVVNLKGVPSRLFEVAGEIDISFESPSGKVKSARFAANGEQQVPFDARSCKIIGA